MTTFLYIKKIELLVLTYMLRAVVSLWKFLILSHRIIDCESCEGS